jgi:hypothetical protein
MQEDFILTSASSFDVSEFSEANLQITFNPSDAGVRTATVTIQNNDSDEGNFTFAIQGTGTTGVASPYIKKIEYIVWYDDDGDGLLLNAGDDRIVIKYALSADHPSGQTAAFAEMDTLGELNAAVGNVVSSPEPEILVSGNSLELTSGDNEPSAADHTDFGSVDTFDGSVNRTFTIRNFGTADLNISSVDIAGAHAGDFSVTASPATTVPAGNETSFTVTFDPSIGGPRSATISIVNNDHEENPFTFAIQGLGTYPPSYNPPTIDQGNQGNQGNSVSVTMSEDGSPTAFALDLTATNIDNAPLSWSLTSGASHGTATASGTGSVPVITYTPEANFNGSDSFTVTVSDDDRGGYDTVTVEVTVEPVNDAPVATSGSVALFADETANIVLSSSDVDGDALTVTIVSGPSHGATIASSSNTPFPQTIPADRPPPLPRWTPWTNSMLRWVTWSPHPNRKSWSQAIAWS